MARQNQGDRVDSQSLISTTGLVSALSAYNSDTKVAASEFIKSRLLREPLTNLLLTNGKEDAQKVLGYGSESVTMKKAIVKMPCNNYNENEKLKLGYVTYKSYDTGYQESVYSYLKLYDKMGAAFEDPAKIRDIVADVMDSVTYILNKGLVEKIIYRLVQGVDKATKGTFAGKGDITYNLGTVTDPVSLSRANAYEFMQNLKQVIKVIDNSLDGSDVVFIVSPGVYNAVKSTKSFVNASESGLSISSTLMSDDQFSKMLREYIGNFYVTDALPSKRDEDGKIIQTVLALKTNSFGVQVNQIENEVGSNPLIKGDMGVYLLIAYAMRLAILNPQGISAGIVKLEGVN